MFGMKILQLEASPGWGGQEIRILKEAEGMRARGHETVFGVMKGGMLIEKARATGFTVYEIRFEKRFWLFSLLQLIWMIHRHKIDIVNTHSSLDSWIGGIAARLTRRVVVRTRHLSTAIKPGWNSRFLYGYLADFVVTTCASIIPMIGLQSGKPHPFLRSIPTGVSPEKMVRDPSRTAMFRKQLGLQEGDFLVGTACFMRSWKGLLDFLQAAHLLRHDPRFRWVIIGGGHETAYRKRVEELNLQNIVHFTGHLEEPFYAIDALDAFALLSTAHEGVSQAILQAAYLGKPLIATPIGGLQEVCLNRETGILVAPFAPHEVAAAVLQLKKDGGKALGEAARRRVLEHFTFVKTLDNMEDVYQSLLGKKQVV